MKHSSECNWLFTPLHCAEISITLKQFYLITEFKFIASSVISHFELIFNHHFYFEFILYFKFFIFIKNLI